MKCWAVYQVPESLRLLGHLDLMRSMQRVLRRSGLPIKYSQGFNPHVLMSLAAPKPVGMAGENELMEFTLTEPLPREAVKEAIQKALPEVMALKGLILRDDKAAALPALVRMASYRVDFYGKPPFSARQLSDFLSQTEIPAVKTTKKGKRSYDMRPLIMQAELKGQSLHCTLSLWEGGACRCDDFLEQLCRFAGVSEAPQVIYTRVRLLDQKAKPLDSYADC